MNRQGERRKDYGSPRTRMVQVETEGNLCGSIKMEADSPHGISTTTQDVNTDFTNENNFKDGTWD